ncbi:putative hydrolase [Gordonia effusa NBRC 100432]|uniref:Putative hydrolase n=1 Tax=Gordonia effusa NBRC 100432 TaxID=1077974 RepID=H0QZZ7_9ACTN|nr:HAD family hydrolase [Gordonia effusa]GAB18398.1 putative hydrolase [Gordonia effusa NBRC 100432]
MGNLRLPPHLRALVFDVGETLVDESRLWSVQADRAGVTPFALMGLIGAMIERGEDHRVAWDLLGCPRPSTSETITTADLYPDALECLRAAKKAGFAVGIAGNQPAAAVTQLSALGFDADYVASSAEWGIAKPAPEFFAKLIAVSGFQPRQIMYIGDRLDNDILPANAAGLRTAFIKRGPWGHLHASDQSVKTADLQLDSLTDLVSALARG